MTRSFHFCQSVDGPLINWTKADWKKATKWITRNDGAKYTPDQLKAAFVEELAKGHRVIPLGEPCDGFNYQTGCPGHPIEEANKT